MIDNSILLPIYLVADRSSSMEPYIDELNSGLIQLLHAMQLEPLAASKIRLSIVGFSGTPELLLARADLRYVEQMPWMTAGGVTNYGAVFDYLYELLRSDVQRLREHGALITRPAVFFLTDGRPTDNEGHENSTSWKPSLARLKGADDSIKPNLLAFGIGEARPDTISEIATHPSFALVSLGTDHVREALTSFAQSLVSSVVASGQALASGSTELPISRPDGFSLAIDILD